VLGNRQHICSNLFWSCKCLRMPQYYGGPSLSRWQSAQEQAAAVVPGASLEDVKSDMGRGMEEDAYF
jgi:hypothetical protein